jgi:N,N'-diacetyllegionaminate synthase
MGASVIEKHFTLDRNLPGPDHRTSLEPHELFAMILGIRNIEKALGTGIKKPSPSELKNKPVARKSIVAASSIEQGETFTEMNITVKRPGTGITPMRWDEIIGRKAVKPYRRDELIET